MPASQRVLTRPRFIEAMTHLTTRHNDLAQALARYGEPPFWRRQPGFATLTLIILEQLVSVESAQAVFRRLSAIVNPLTPEHLLATDPAQLRAAGLTRQKLATCRALATAVIKRQLDLTALNRQSDSAVQAALTQIKGIGPWTANIYLLLALRRPDVWPSGDIALANAVQELRRLETRPAQTQLLEFSEAWRPWRSVAVRMLWHFYLSARNRTLP